VPVGDPTEQQFRRLFDMVAAELGVDIRPGSVDHLIDRHYRPGERSFRFCHPRDLLLQILNDSRYRGIAPTMTVQSVDRAVESYFSVI
jgi:hypothetical protein